jgi:hypothetical protein
MRCVGLDGRVTTQRKTQAHFDFWRGSSFRQGVGLLYEMGPVALTDSSEIGIFLVPPKNPFSSQRVGLG